MNVTLPLHSVVVFLLSSNRWPNYHWQILHVGPDGCIRGSLEPYKFMKGPCINDGQWHHIALTASSDWQCMFVDGWVVCSRNFGIGHELHRYFKCNMIEYKINSVVVTSTHCFNQDNLINVRIMF